MRRRPQRNKQVVKQDSFFQTEFGLLSFLLIKSNARRTLSITIDENARVQVAVPYHCGEKEVHRFIREKSKWIFEKLEEAQRNKSIIQGKRFDDGQKFLFLGKNFPLSVCSKNVKRSRIDFNGNQWQVDLPQGLEGDKKEDAVRSKLIRWYRQQAQELLGGRIFHYAKIMDLQPQGITIRSFKRLWGNCDYRTKLIQLNWQIILSPLCVIDYVVVHELCHLVHPNHSKRFWAKVEKYMPDYREHKRWLSDHAINMYLP